MPRRAPPSDPNTLATPEIVSPGVSPKLAHNEPHFRSGAVARLAGMPVSTLRIWEQRYRAVGPHTSPTGHRLYSSADLERVVVLRQLTTQGHAIGSLAGLDLAQLQQLQAKAQGQALAAAAAAAAPASLRLVVVGPALGQRLQRLQRLTAHPQAGALQVVAVFESLEQARAAAVRSGPVDVLLWQAAGLQAGQGPVLAAAQHAWQARHAAVVYRFSGAAARQALARAGVALAREPISGSSGDEALARWLVSLALPAAAAGAVDVPQIDPSAPQAWLPPALHASGAVAPARRFDDAAVAAWSGMATGVACDCPRHVADLLAQMNAFEAYSADCQHRSPADADLHAYLLRVAGAARVLLETALERVAATEGWVLPPIAVPHMSGPVTR